MSDIQEVVEVEESLESLIASESVESVETLEAAKTPVELSEEDHLAAGDVFCCNKWMTPDEVAACKAAKHEAEAAAVVDWRTPR